LYVENKNRVVQSLGKDNIIGGQIGIAEHTIGECTWCLSYGKPRHIIRVIYSTRDLTEQRSGK